MKELPPLPRHLDEICDRFESAWQDAGMGLVRPRLEEYLVGNNEPYWHPLLLELLGLDICYRKLLGETPTLEEYQKRFPGVSLEEIVHDLDSTINVTGSLELADLSRRFTTRGSPLPVRVPGYDVLAEIGRGAMGVVYQARHLHLKRIVALKMILAGNHAGSEQRQRFLAEAEVVAALQHPNIVQIYECGSHGDLPYLELEYVNGGSLHSWLQKGLPSPLEAAWLVEQLARSMAVAHAKHIIHRDLKPHNVLLATPDGIEPEQVPLTTCTPKITDFGLAKHVEGDSGLTQTGAILGTPSYMAPEQAEYKKEIGPAADIYALGAILYECLTGRPPFRGSSPMDTIQLVIATDPVTVRQLQPNCPRDLETICHKCLQKGPSRRYATALDLAEDLQRFQRGMPVRARPVGMLEVARRWCQRNPGWASALLLLVVVAIGALSSAWFLFTANQQLAQAVRESQQSLLDSLLSQARGNQTSGRAGQRFESLKALGQAASVARKLGKGKEEILALRNQAIACLPLHDLRIRREWDGNPPGTNGLGFDAGFNRYAWSSAADGIEVRQVADDDVLFRLPLRKADRADGWIDLGFSPSGRFLTVRYQGRTPCLLDVWDLQSDSSQPCLEVENQFGIPDFSPDERTLAVGLPRGDIGLYDLPAGSLRQKLPLGSSVLTLAFRPDGQALAVANTKDFTVDILELASGNVVRHLLHQGYVRTIVWRPKGANDGETLLATGCDDLRIYLWSKEENQPPRHLDGHGWEVNQLAFNATGSQLISFGWEMTLRLWDLETRRLLLTQPNVRVFGFSTENGLSAALLQANQVQIVDVIPPEVHQVLYGYRQHVNFVGFHPIHGWLTSSGWDGKLRLWDVDRQCILGQIDRGIETVFLWESSGKGLLTNTDKALLRWPVEVRVGPEERQARIGPPAHLMAPEDRGFKNGRLAWCGPEDRLLATSSSREAMVRLFQMGKWPEKIGTLDQLDGRFLSGSSDGRWLATGTGSTGDGFSVWEVNSKEKVKKGNFRGAEVAFSPDNKWLVFTTGRLSEQGISMVHSWRVGTWEEHNQAKLQRPTTEPAIPAFSPDSDTLAVTNTMTDIRLLDPETLEEIATLTAPDTQLIVHMAFSADSTRLAAAASQAVHVWDLRRLRQELAKLDLDWERHPYPAAPAETVPWRIEVVPGQAQP